METLNFAHLTHFLSDTTVRQLQEHGWPLQAQADVSTSTAQAEAQGWRSFPLAEEFLSVFDGFITVADEEIYKEAWQAVPITADDHAPLRKLREDQAIFPIGLGAGWAHLLLTPEGHIVCSLNGSPQPVRPDDTIDRLIRSMILQRELDAKEHQ